MPRKKKPEGFEQFQKLLGPLSKVPKPELDREVEKHKKKAAKKKKRA
jgi:hypothetical protein